MNQKDKSLGYTGLRPGTKSASISKIPRLANLVNKARQAGAATKTVLNTPVSARLANRGIKAWTGVPRHNTYAQHFSQKPIKAFLRALKGPVFPFKKTIIGGAGLYAGARPMHRAYENIRSLNNTLFEQLQALYPKLGLDPLDRDTYNEERNELLRTVWNYIRGKPQPLSADPSYKDLVMDTYGSPLLAETIRRGLTGEPKLKLSDALSPQKALLTKTSPARRLRTNIVNRVITPQSLHDIANRGNERLVEKIKEDPELLLRISNQMLGNRETLGTLSASDREALINAAMQLREADVNVSPADSAEYQRFLARTLGSVGVLANPTVSDILAAGSYAMVTPNPYVHKPSARTLLLNYNLSRGRDVNFTNNTHSPMYREGTVYPGWAMHRASPGMTAHEIGHQLGDQARQGSLRSNVYTTSRRARRLSPGPIVRQNRIYNPIKPDSNLAQSLAVLHALASTPMLAHEIEDSIRGAGHARRTLQDSGATNTEILRTQAGAFQGIPTYFNHTFAPLIEVQNAKRQSTQN